MAAAALQNLQFGNQLSQGPGFGNWDGEQIEIGVTHSEQVPFNVVISEIDREIGLKSSCKNIPVSFLFYFAFVWSAWLKCDVYNYGLGSSMLAVLEDCEELAFPMTGTEGLGDGEKVMSYDTLWTYIADGIVPVLWSEGFGRFRRFHKLLGGVRIRQLRQGLVVCGQDKLHEWLGPPGACREFGTIDTSDYGPLKPGGSNITVGMDGKWDNPWQISDVDESGQLYEVRLPANIPEEEIIQRVHGLWDAGWMDYQTNSIYLQIGVYNGEVDAWVIAEDVYHFTADGAVKHIRRVATGNNLFRSWYYYSADCMVWLVLMVVFFDELGEVCATAKKGRFIQDYVSGTAAMWNASDWFGLILGMGTMSGYIHLFLVREAMAEDLAKQSFDTVDTQSVEWSKSMDDLQSLISQKKEHEVFLFIFSLTILVRFFKSFRKQPRLAVLSTTFAMCCSELMYFMVIFMVVFTNFTITAFLLFSSQIYGFASLSQSLNECFKILMRKYEFDPMFNVHPWAASMWFWFFNILAYIVVLSMLLAVILETHSKALADTAALITQSHGFSTQLYNLWLQSRLLGWIVRRKGGRPWRAIEVVREDLITMEKNRPNETRRSTRRRGVSMKAKEGEEQPDLRPPFWVTEKTLEELDLPMPQVTFLWAIFKTHPECQLVEIAAHNKRVSQNARAWQAAMDAEKEEMERKAREAAGEEPLVPAISVPGQNPMEQNGDEDEIALPLPERFYDLEDRFAVQKDVLTFGFGELKDRLAELKTAGIKLEASKVSSPLRTKEADGLAKAGIHPGLVATEMVPPPADVCEAALTAAIEKAANAATTRRKRSRSPKKDNGMISWV